MANAAEATEMAETVVCRHCGAAYPSDNPPEDWLCQQCERYQDQVSCPTCRQPTRLSLLPPSAAKQAVAAGNARAATQKDDTE